MLIELSNGSLTMVEPSDYAYLSGFHWKAKRSHSKTYAIRRATINGKRVTIFMHRHIMQASPSVDVHHLNKIPLDNRRSNLQILAPYFHNLIHHRLRVKYA